MFLNISGECEKCNLTINDSNMKKSFPILNRRKYLINSNSFSSDFFSKIFNTYDSCTPSTTGHWLRGIPSKAKSSKSSVNPFLIIRCGPLFGEKSSSKTNSDSKLYGSSPIKTLHMHVNNFITTSIKMNSQICAAWEHIYILNSL